MTEFNEQELDKFDNAVSSANAMSALAPNGERVNYDGNNSPATNNAIAATGEGAANNIDYFRQMGAAERGIRIAFNNGSYFDNNGKLCAEYQEAPNLEMLSKADSIAYKTEQGYWERVRVPAALEELNAAKKALDDLKQNGGAISRDEDGYLEGGADEEDAAVATLPEVQAKKIKDATKRLGEAQKNYADIIALSRYFSASDKALGTILDRVNSADTWYGALAEGMKASVEEDGGLFAIASEGVKSFAGMAPYAVQMAVGNKALGASKVAMALSGAETYVSSRNAELGMSVLEVMRENNVDVTDPQAVAAAFNDPKIAEGIRLKLERANVVGAMDAIAGMFVPIRLNPSNSLRIARDAVALQKASGQKGVHAFVDALDDARRLGKGPTSTAGKIGSGVENVILQGQLQGIAGGAGEALGSLVEGKEINKGDVFLEYVSELIAGSHEVLTTTVGIANQERTNAINAERAKQTQSALTDLVRAAEGAQVALQDGERVREWVERVGGDQVVFIDGKVAMDQGLVEEIRAVDPLMANRLEQGAQNGESVAVPVASLAQMATNPDNEKLAEKIIYDSRTIQDGMSPREAEEFAKNGRQQAIDHFEREIERAKPDITTSKLAHKVATDLGNQLASAGMPRDYANAVAKPWEAYLVNRAKQLGISPEEIARRLNLRVQRRGGVYGVTRGGTEGGVLNGVDTATPAGSRPVTIDDYKAPARSVMRGRLPLTLNRQGLSGGESVLTDGTNQEKDIESRLAEYRARLESWTSPETLRFAEGKKDDDEIIALLGNEKEPIAIIPEGIVKKYLGEDVDNTLYCGKGYFVAHVVKHHSNIPIERHLELQEMLESPDEVLIDNRADEKGTKKNALIFVKRYESSYMLAVRVEAGSDGKITLYKSLSKTERKKPYPKLDRVDLSVAGTPEGHSRYSHAPEGAPGGSLISALDSGKLPQNQQEINDVSVAIGDDDSFGQGKVIKIKSEEYDNPDWFVLKRTLDNMTVTDRAVFDEYVASRPDAERIMNNLNRLKDTPWAKQAIEGVFVRAAMIDLMNGREPRAQSMLDHPQMKNTRYDLSRGEQGLWDRLLQSGFVGEASKPAHNVNSSFINCDPSNDCAKFCYATKGNYKYAATVVKSELVCEAIRINPAKAAEMTARSYKGTAEYANGKALRLFDKGDGDETWIPYIKELNKQGIRVQIFSKRPEFLRMVPDMNLRLLSIDESNKELAAQNPDLDVAFVYSSEKQIPEIIELNNSGRLQVVLPVKLSSSKKAMEVRKNLVNALRIADKTVSKHICPIDAGWKTIKDKKHPEGWNCTMCDKNGGCGCFFGKATKAIMDSAAKADAQVNAIEGEDLRALVLQLQALKKEYDNEAGIGGSSESAADGNRAEHGQDLTAGRRARISNVSARMEDLLGQLLAGVDAGAKRNVLRGNGGQTATVHAGVPQARPGLDNPGDGRPVGDAGVSDGGPAASDAGRGGSFGQSAVDQANAELQNNWQTDDTPSMAEVRAKYEGTDEWMKAPNGKPTNLTERQWLQVRTPEFKLWFGDWDIKNTKFDIVYAGRTDINSQESAIAKAGELGIIGTIPSEETNGKGDIQITVASLREMLNPKQRAKTGDNATHYAIIPVLREVIKSARIVSSSHDYAKDSSGVRTPAAGINNRVMVDVAYAAVRLDDGKVHPVRIRLKRYKDENQSGKAYSYHVENVEVLSGTLGQAKNGSNPADNTSIVSSMLLDGIPDVNGHSVLNGHSKVVDENGEPKVVYHITDEQFSTFDMSKARQYSDIPAAFFSSGTSDWADMGRYTMGVFLNIRNPADKPYVGGRGQEVLAELKAKGFDGTISHEDGMETEYAAFEPNQIKSATGNNGNFDWRRDNVFEQSANQDRRGQYTPSNIANPDYRKSGLVELMEHADKSTFLHESAHAWLDADTMLAKDLRRVLASGQELTKGEQRFLRGLAGFFRWGVKEGVLDNTFNVKSSDFDGIIAAAEAWSQMSVAEQRDMHELFAEGFESYLMNGRAPNAEMLGVFQRFAEWLKDVYRSVTKQPRPISKDVAKLYDMLFVSEQEAKEADARAAASPLFQPEPVDTDGMSPEEKSQYELMVQRAKAATEEAIRKVMAKAAAFKALVAPDEATQVARTQKDRLERVKKMLEEMPKHKARKMILEGNRDFYGNMQIDPQSLLDNGFDKETVKVLQRKKLCAERGGTTIEQIAELCGHNDKLALVAELVDIEAPHKEALGIVAAQVRDEMGIDPEAYSETLADLAAHNDERSQLLTAEYNAICRKLGRRQFTHATAREWALNKINSMKVGEIYPKAYIRDEAKNARKAEEAFRKGDLAGCLEYKRAQIAAHHMAKAALELQAAREKATRLAGMASRSDRVDGMFRKAIQVILQNHYMGNMTAAEREEYSKLDPVKLSEDFVKELQDAGTPVEGLANLMSDRSQIKDMTANDARTLFETLSMLNSMGRNRVKQALIDEAQTVSEVVKAGKARLQDAPDMPAQVTGAIQDQPRTKLEKTTDKLRQFFVSHVSMQTFCRVLDGNKDGGWWWKLFIRSANRRANFENAHRGAVAEQLREIFRPVFKKDQFENPVRIDGFDKPFDHGQRLVIALNLGNESNRQRLVGGDPRWTPEAIKQVLDTLTETDWRAVEQVWKLFESYRPLIAAKEKRVNGVEPEWIDFKPFDVVTAEGKRITVSGGYYPVKYNPRASNRAQQYEDAASTMSELQSNYQSSTTRRSFVKSRQQAVMGMPLTTEFTGLYDGLNDIIHDLAWHEWLIETKKVLDGVHGSGGLREDIRQRYGTQYAKMLEDWRKDIAQGGRTPSDSDVGAICTPASKYVGLMTMGWNLMSGAVQLLGAGYAVPRAGAGNVLIASRKFCTNFGLRKEINEKSAMMALRAKTMNRDIADIRNKLESGDNIIRDHAFDLIQLTQGISDTITWQACYESAIKQGMTEAEAIEVADQGVIDTQSSGNVSDQSAIMRDKGIFRIFTTFYSWANAALNMSVYTKYGERNKVKKLAALLWMGMAMPIIEKYYREALTAEGDDDDKDDPLMHELRKAGGAVAEYHLGLLVGAREFSNTVGSVVAGEHVFGYSGPAGMRPVQTVASAFDAAVNPTDRKVINTVLDIFGCITGAPSGQAKKTIKGIMAIDQGRVEGMDAVLAPLFGYSGKLDKQDKWW